MTQWTVLHPYLAAQIGAGQVSHAYIFSGEQAEAQAEAFAAALLCPQPGPQGDACGDCPVCRNLAAGTFADCRRLLPQGSLHKVDDMRDLVARAGLSPISGRRKVFILQQAEQLGDEAANTLLKLLEEPSPDTVLLLLTDQPDALLPTILSRCQQFVFAGGSELSDVLPPEILTAAEGLLRALPELPLYQVLISAREYEKDREAQKQFFFALLTLLHRAARGQTGLPMSGEAVLRSANMLESSLDMLNRNVNQKLLTDIVYLRLWQNCQA